MNRKTFTKTAAAHLKFAAAIGVSVALLVPHSLLAQQGGRGGPPQGRTPQHVAPIDVTGYWESRIVDEWRFRVTPQKGDIAWMQMNAEARKIAMAWDPAKDEADGKACKAYGAVGVTQRPGLMHVTWADGNTLKLDFDTGTQSRLLHFAKAPADKGPATWQGYSAAQWDTPGNVLIFTGDRYVQPRWFAGRPRPHRKPALSASPRRTCCPAMFARTECRTATRRCSRNT